LFGAREGVDALTWYFYGDLGSYGLFAVSGLITYTPYSYKPVYYALRNLMSVVGEYHHVAALVESEDEYVYLWETSNGASSVLIAWRPADDGDLTRVSKSTVTLTTLASIVLQNSIVEIGVDASGPTTLAANTFVVSNKNTITMELSGFPRVAKVQASVNHANTIKIA